MIAVHLDCEKARESKTSKADIKGFILQWDMLDLENRNINKNWPQISHF